MIQGPTAFPRFSFFRLAPFRMAPALALLALLAASICVTHAGSQSPQFPPGQSRRPPFDDMGDMDPVAAARRVKALNIERQKSMVSDADKLVQLARELNTEIGQTAPDSLTAVQLRKIADIERLARSVRQKMSYAAVDEPPFQGFPIPIQ